MRSIGKWLGYGALFLSACALARFVGAGGDSAGPVGTGAEARAAGAPGSAPRDGDQTERERRLEALRRASTALAQAGDRKALAALELPPDASEFQRRAVKDPLRGIETEGRIYDLARAPVNAAAQRCWEASPGAGPSQIRLSLAVDSSTDHLTVRSAAFDTVVKGAPVSDAFTRCLVAAIPRGLAAERGEHDRGFIDFTGDYAFELTVPVVTATPTRDPAP